MLTTAFIRMQKVYLMLNYQTVHTLFTLKPKILGNVQSSG